MIGKRKRRPKVLVTFDMRHLPESRALLEADADVTYRVEPERPELLVLIADADAIIPNLRQRIGRREMDAGRNLKVIATPSTGTDHIDVAYAGSRGIVVQSLKDDPDLLRTVSSTAEHAFLLMLACLRKLPFAFDAVRAGRWTSGDFHGREAAWRTVGIIGCGRLGEMFSRFAKGFGMKVIACDPFRKISDGWVRQVDFESLLREAEIIRDYHDPRSSGREDEQEGRREGICADAAGGVPCEHVPRRAGG